MIFPKKTDRAAAFPGQARPLVKDPPTLIGSKDQEKIKYA
jgi:hypothetical protein